jgi:hypothetical protein
MAKRKVRLTPEESSSVEVPSTIQSETSPSEPVREAGSEERQPFAEAGTEGRRGRVLKQKMTVPLQEDGTPDIASCKAETLAQLRALLVDPKVREQLGIAGIPADQLFSEQDISTLLDILGGIEGQIFVFLGKLDQDIAVKYAQFQPHEKQMIIPPMRNVLGKHAASLGWFLSYRDEIALTLLFVSLTRAKYAGAKQEQQMRKDGLIPPMADKVAPIVETEQKTNGQEFVVDETVPN